MIMKDWGQNREQEFADEAEALAQERYDAEYYTLPDSIQQEIAERADADMLEADRQADAMAEPEAPWLSYAGDAFMTRYMDCTNEQ